VEKNIALRVENLSKYYRLGIKESVKDSMVASLVDVFKSPIKNYRKYKSLYDFSDLNENPKNILKALHDISFEMKPGERLGIIGHNGAGKSTLLKILSRITPPSNGVVTIRGKVSSLLEVGTGFHPELTGRENIYLNGIILGMRKAEVDRKFDEIVDFSGVEQFLETPVKRYSSGMRVRLAFSVAAHLDPEILVIDEVLAVGDADFQHKCLNKMDDVAKGGRTIIFVSHNMGAITQLCERAIWLDKGGLREDGPANDIVASYLNAGTSSHSEWIPGIKDAPIHSHIKLIKAKLLDPVSNTPSVLTDYSKPLQLEIEYEIMKGSRNVHILYWISDMSGNVVYMSIDTDGQNSFGQLRESGVYKSKARTATFLKPGRYNITIGAGDEPRLIDQYENVLTFDISTRECNMFSSDRIGLILPAFDWEIERINTEN